VKHRIPGVLWVPAIASFSRIASATRLAMETINLTAGEGVVGALRKECCSCPGQKPGNVRLLASPANLANEKRSLIKAIQNEHHFVS